MKSLFALVLASSRAFASDAASAAPPAEAACSMLASGLGEEPFKLLADRGYVVYFDGKDGRRGLMSAQWDQMKNLGDRAPSLLAFLDLADKVSAGQEGASPRGLRELADLPAYGLWTPQLKAALQVLLAHQENAAAMGDALSSAAKNPLLFSARWAESFLARRRAEQAADFRPLAAPYFEEMLASPAAPKEAAAHLTAHAQAVYGKDISPLLSQDLSEGRPSDKTVGWIAKYLIDQRQLWRASATRERLKALTKGSAFRTAAADLRLALPALDRGRTSLDAAQGTLGRAAPAPRLRLSAEKLHVVSREAAPSFDIGDEAEVSLAYWIEGLDKGESVSLTEAGFVEAPGAGWVALKVSRSRRKSGGPYVFSAKVPLDAYGTLRYRFLLGGAGVPAFSRDADIQVSPRLTNAFLLAARAEALAAQCKLQESSQAYAELADKLTPFSRKSQFKRLESAASSRSALLARQAEALRGLPTMVEDARKAASKDACDFRDGPALKALDALRGLNPGCDSTLALEFSGLLRAAQSRRARQDAFRSAVDKAASLEESCKAPAASELYASALSLLDAEPEARCGPWAKEHEKVLAQALPRARGAGALAQSLAEEQAEASKRYSAGDFAGALAVLDPLVARIDSLPDRKCFKTQRGQAQQLAEAAGASLGPADPQALRAALPEDAHDSEVQDVASERQRLARLEESRRRRENARQAPNPAPAAEDASAQEKSR